jgi:hypothetical protein
MAQHKGKCRECLICAQASCATPYAQERIDRALRGEDALEWVQVAATHSDTDYAKAEAMLSWVFNKRWDFSLECVPVGRLSSERVAEFTLGGQHQRVLVRTYEEEFIDACHIVIDGRVLGGFCFPISNWRVYESPLQFGKRRPDVSAYSYHKISRTYKSGTFAIIARVLRELISSGDLRVKWMPLHKVPNNLHRELMKVEYAQCEHGQWDSAEKKLMKV